MADFSDRTGWARRRETRTAPAGEPEALLERMRRGDQAALAGLYDHLGNAVFGLARHVLRDPDLAQETTQDVFVELWRTAARYDPAKGSAKTWVMTLAHRRAVDRVRTEQATRERETRVARRDTVPAADIVLEEVEAHLDQERVRRALRGLTDLQREVIELAYYRGNTYREVAELLDVPLGTAKTRLRDALIRLRDQLGVTR